MNRLSIAERRLPASNDVRELVPTKVFISPELATSTSQDLSVPLLLLYRVYDRREPAFLSAEEIRKQKL